MLSLSRPFGSDCGIVNVNIPTNGAEIGGAFGKIYRHVIFVVFSFVGKAGQELIMAIPC